ncbi:MAG TPA: LytR C-terminal domain-containing protein [Enteractinococcus sp.]
MKQDVETQYPRDRFDDVEPYTTQQGAHRKEFSAPKGVGQLNAIILAGGAALAIGVGAYLWLAPSDPLNISSPEPTETAAAPVEEESAEPEPTEEPEEVVEPEPVEDPVEQDEEEPEPSPTPEPTEEETEEPEESVDYTLPISVYNASNVQGYAASVAQNLGGAGFNVPVADNWTGNIPSQTTVYFSSNEATALAVADEVGAIAVYEPSVDGVLVVLTAN